MTRMIWPLALATLGIVYPAAAEPFVYYRGAVNAASFAPAGLPNGSIARGSIFSLFGRGLGPAEGAQAAAFPLEESLAGTSVDVCAERTCAAAIPLFVRDGQVNAIMPSNAPLGPVSIRARYNGETGPFTAARVVESSVGIFAVSAGGFGPGIVQNVSAAERPINSHALGARRGQVVTIWATGLGAALNGIDNQPPQVGSLPVPVEVFIGGRRVSNLLYAGRSAEFPGLDQFNAEIPADAPLGCYVPVMIRTAGIVSNAVTMAISADGGRCTDPESPFEPLVAAGRFGVIFLQRSERIQDELDVRRMIVTDDLIATFREDAVWDFSFNPLFAPSAPGSCHVFSVAGDVFDRRDLPGVRAARDLDAGSSLLTSTNAGMRSAAPPADGPGFYLGAFGSNMRDEFPGGALVFDGSGPFTVSGSGGADVGPFEAIMSPGEAVEWANRDATESVDRAAGVTLTFSGGDQATRVISIWGGGYDRPSDASTMFGCYAEHGAAGFHVPPEVLANVPPTRRGPFRSKGWLGVASASVEGHAAFSADGIAGGIAIFSVMKAKTVRYR